MTDRIINLKNYIKDNLDKNGGIWEYVINLEIREGISELDESESEIFSIEILTWNETILYHLADGIIFSQNKYIDQDYLYCLIFLKINDKDKLDYLVENLYACYTNLDKETKPLDFFIRMRDKIKKEYDEIKVEDFFMLELNEIINKKNKRLF
ncbi:hypothetical protein GKZ90_0022060 [Flavobacterium sp. MC2016-06]|uniref:hypothetical protein n=1 Tax=Flavobacterium sp. MC2016-06 TaxID=2676308 RepID=UPI0012BAF4F6|nr:hypothetical protein [Flavobacterium sp. MC2016-06]MBU3861108.1 hypothetical protein [Flavobacterium sp. MC2016-06]